LAFLRAAQYFRIRSLTAFRCAADIGPRFRVDRSAVAEGSGEISAGVRRAGSRK
jgi:hypothetical protein